MPQIPANKILKDATENYAAEYVTWHNMKRRCYNEKSSNYKYYGAKGVKVCEEWLCPLTGFVTFYRDMGPRPKGYSLDRINPYGDYEPSNCRWADSKTQRLNQRYQDKTRPYTYNGVTMTVKEWSKTLGIKQSVINTRIRKGYAPDQVMAQGSLSGKRRGMLTQPDTTPR